MEVLPKKGKLYKIIDLYVIKGNEIHMDEYGFGMFIYFHTTSSGENFYALLTKSGRIEYFDSSCFYLENVN